MAEIYSAEDGTLQGSTSVFEDDPPEFLVKYYSEYGDSFRVIFRVKRRSIGFKVEK